MLYPIIPAVAQLEGLVQSSHIPFLHVRLDMHVFSTVVVPIVPHVALTPKFDPAHTLVLPVLSIFVHVAPSQQVFGYTPVDWSVVSSQISPICAVQAGVVVVDALLVVVVPVPDVVVSELEQEEEHTFEQHSSPELQGPCFCV